MRNPNEEGAEEKTPLKTGPTNNIVPCRPDKNTAEKPQDAIDPGDDEEEGAEHVRRTRHEPHDLAPESWTPKNRNYVFRLFSPVCLCLSAARPLLRLPSRQGKFICPPQSLKHPGYMVSVVERPTLGRVLIAERSFKLRDIILSEKPLLHWPVSTSDANTFVNLARAWEEAEESTRIKVLDLFAPSANEISAGSNNLFMFLSWHAKKLADTHPRVPFPVWFKVLAAVTFNAHTYKKTNSVLFELKSKCAHSCSPVAVHRGDDLVCIRPIEKGDLATIGYVGEDDINLFDTMDRRRFLWDHYLFHCACERCVQPDYARILKCPLCKKSAVLFSAARWCCTSCKQKKPAPGRGAAARFLNRVFP